MVAKIDRRSALPVSELTSHTETVWDLFDNGWWNQRPPPTSGASRFFWNRRKPSLSLKPGLGAGFVSS
jgi:hypothetical protein